MSDQSKAPKCDQCDTDRAFKVERHGPYEESRYFCQDHFLAFISYPIAKKADGTTVAKGTFNITAL